MSKTVGIQFKNCGRVYDFDSGHFVLQRGDKVIVVTEDGPAIGCVVKEPQTRSPERSNQPIKKIFRLATPEEVETYERGCKLEMDLFAYCYQRVKERDIPMSLAAVERRFDGSKVVVYFTADGRVDFRELVKDLVSRFGIRIEMRQIGVRHQAKMVGGIGTCGRVLCCSNFMTNFDPITIKMAKKQNLSLNPSKISGMCGRLMCCLTFEHVFYEEAKKNLPKIGKKIKIPQGEGKVIRQNVLKETLTVALESGEEVELRASEVQVESPPPPPSPSKKRKPRKE